MKRFEPIKFNLKYEITYLKTEGYTKDGHHLKVNDEVIGIIDFNI